ncbi:hypothetical protein [uncultured Duncaniella sp.]|uniref:hypothetical protein n=1 Tax=uncultured Duncaniella sp. TaxID=2768039 RepID=UPI00261FF836|nr:hypothetical protein [uncultured Duncaniella sp.]
MKITYDSGHVMQLKPKEVKSLLTSIRKLELYIKKLDSTGQLLDGMRPYGAVCGEEPMRILAEMEQLYDLM